MKKLCEELHIKPLPCYEKIYDAAMADFEKNGAYIAEKERISECIQKFGILKKWEKELGEAAEGVRQNETLLRFVYLLKHALSTEGVFDELLEITLPKIDANAVTLDFAPMFSMFPLLSLMEKNLQERNLPQKIILDSMQEFEEKADSFFMQHKKPGIGIHAVWLYKFIHGMILRVGRLNFEIFKDFDADVVVFENQKGAYAILLSGEAVSADIQETDTDYIGIKADAVRPEGKEMVTLPKSEWKPILKRGDAIVSVHIPSGGKLLPELCEAAYAEMQSILKTYYPDYQYIMFACEHSWLMDPHLTNFLSPTSNIIQFQERYMRYRNKANGKGVFDFLFYVPHETAIRDLPADTSLRKAIKAHYMEGGLILEQGGLLLGTKRSEKE